MECPFPICAERNCLVHGCFIRAFVLQGGCSASSWFSGCCREPDDLHEAMRSHAQSVLVLIRVWTGGRGECDVPFLHILKGRDRGGSGERHSRR